MRHPFFIETDRGRLFALHYSGIAGHETNLSAILFAPFAEEMNRSRRMMTLQAEALAKRGVDVLVFDYTGTGDSSGDFRDATWVDWHADGTAALEWMHERTGKPVVLIGIRLGAAIAVAVAGTHRSLASAGVVFWQPVVTGATFLTQFLRVRVASSLAEDDRKETTTELRERLFNGEALEVAGYTVPPEIARAIHTFKLTEVDPLPVSPIFWIELSIGEGTVSPGSVTALERLRQRGAVITERAVPGEPFWAIQETTLAPAFIEATTQLLTGNAG